MSFLFPVLGAMSVTPPLTADVADLLSNPLRIFDCKVSLLKAAWKQLDQSDFEHASTKHLRLDLIKRANYTQFKAEQASASARDEHETCPPASSSDHASTSSTSSSKSYKQAVTASQTPVTSVPQSRTLQTRLAEVEVMVKDTQHRLRALERQAENVEQQNRELCLVLHNVPETSETKEEDAAVIAALVWETHEDVADIDLDINRLGTRCSDRNKHRPVVVRFDTVDEKHIFLKHAKQLKPAGINWDDYLTRHQQKERQALTADFQTLRGKGYKPFFRGSQLKYRVADKTKNCRLGHALKATTA